MFDNGSNQMATQLSQDIPNASMMMMMYSATFGNIAFAIQPATPSPVQMGFPTATGPSLEAIFYNQQMSNPMVAPYQVGTGNTSGSQNISGQQTVTDSTGTVRMVSGYSANGF